MADPALVPLTPADGWHPQFDEYVVGYYIHHGYCYLDGIIASQEGDPPATQTLLTVPSEARPLAPVSLTIYYVREGTDFTRDAALVLPTSYAATIGADGVLSLDDPVPDQINTAPSITDYWFIGFTSLFGNTYPEYPRPFDLSLSLGNLRWPVVLSPPGDSFTEVDLAPNVSGGDFTSIDAKYAVHGSRVHLAGTVQANIDSPSVVLNTLPADAVDGLSTDFLDDSTTLPDGRALTVSGGGEYAPLDTDATPAAGDIPYLTTCNPGPNFQTNVYGTSVIYEQNLRGYGMPPDAPDPTDYVDYALGTAYTFGDFSNYKEQSFGTYICSGNTCRSPGIFQDSESLDIDALLARIYPHPDWFAIELVVDLSDGLAPNEGCVGGNCGPFMDPGYSVNILAGSAGPDWKMVELTDYVTPVSPTGSVDVVGGSFGSFFGWLVPASPVHTTGSPIGLQPGSNTGPAPPASIFWQWGQLTGTLDISWQAIVWRAAIHIRLFLTPYWNQRDDGLHAGDTLSLDGAGWPGAITAEPPMPGAIAAGPVVGGTVRVKAPKRPRGPLLPNN